MNLYFLGEDFRLPVEALERKFCWERYWALVSIPVSPRSSFRPTYPSRIQPGRRHIIVGNPQPGDDSA